MKVRDDLDLDLALSFRSVNNQTTEKYTYKEEPQKKPKTAHKDLYLSFLDKYDDVENTIETFETMDFVYLFQRKAVENKVNYVVTNKARDGAVFKKLLQSVSKVDLFTMIEFMFASNQNYLDKTKLAPTILISKWLPTIQSDSALWAEGKYTPKEAKKAVVREWHGNTQETKTSIGEW